MTLDRLVLVPLAIGHLALFVLLINVTHGLGHDERRMDRAKVWMVLLFTAATAILAWRIGTGSVLALSWPVLAYLTLCAVTGLLFLPLCSAYLHLRPRPTGIVGRTAEVDLARCLGRESLIGPGKHAWMLRLPGNESFRLRKVEWDVGVPGLPEALDGLSVLHLSDLHMAPCLDRRYFEAVVDEASTLEADLTLFTGDLVDDETVFPWIVPLFRRLHGRLGSFAVLGNHDYKHHPRQSLRELEAAGFVTLEGAWAAIDHGGARTVLGGTSHPWGPRLVEEDRPAGDFHILLSHAPDLFYWAERTGFDLMLAGHNHGGQVRLPLVGPVFMPSIYSRRFDRGFFRRRGLLLHVSQGISGMHPVRYGCVPELGRLVLRRVARDPVDDRPSTRGRQSHPVGRIV